MFNHIRNDIFPCLSSKPPAQCCVCTHWAVIRPQSIDTEPGLGIFSALNLSSCVFYNTVGLNPSLQCHWRGTLIVFTTLLIVILLLILTTWWSGILTLMHSQHKAKQQRKTVALQEFQRFLLILGMFRDIFDVVTESSLEYSSSESCILTLTLNEWVSGFLKPSLQMVFYTLGRFPVHHIFLYFKKAPKIRNKIRITR